MKKAFCLILKKWNSLVVSTSSIGLAFFLLTYPTIFNTKTEYAVLSYLFKDNFYIGLLLIFGLIKLVGIISNNLLCRRIGLIGLNVVWALLTYALFTQFLNGSINAGWIYTAAITAVGVGITLQEQFHE